MDLVYSRPPPDCGAVTEDIVLFAHAQKGLTRVGGLRLHTPNVTTTNDYKVEPDNLLTLEDVKWICTQREQAPDVLFGEVRNFEWQVSALSGR